MKREVSSPQLTTFFKLFGPVGALTIFIGYTLSYLTGVLDISGGTRGLGWIVLFCAALVLLVSWSSLKLKRVSFDDLYIYVSHGREEIRIPLTHVAEIFPVGFPYITIIVRLVGPLKFGHEIMFIPHDRRAQDLRTGLHPTILALKRAINLAQTPTPNPAFEKDCKLPPK